MVKLGEFLHLVDRTEKVVSDKLYRQVGVRVWGKGAYERESILGCNTKYKEFSKVHANDIIVNKIWARNGSIAIVTGELDGFYCSSEFPLFVVNEKKARLGWVTWLIKTPWFWKQCMEKSGGTSGKNRISPYQFLEINVELPPLDKQTEACHRLDNSAPSISELGLVNKETSILIRDLRQSILQEAVSGKLVPQDLNDEPASEVVKKIRAEKERLFKEKKIKKEKDPPPITKEEIPYELPKTWLWTRLQDVFDVRDGTHSTPKYVDKGFPLVTSKNIYKGRFDLTEVKFISEKDHLEISKRSKVDRDDILFAMIGSIGNPVLIESEPNFSIKNVALFKYYDVKLTEPKYLLYFLRAVESRMDKRASGAVQSFVSLNFLRRYLFPLPPTAEQKRIVSRMDELMRLLNELEKTVNENQMNSEFLMGTVLKEAFAS